MKLLKKLKLSLSLFSFLPILSVAINVNNSNSIQEVQKKSSEPIPVKEEKALPNFNNRKNQKQTYKEISFLKTKYNSGKKAKTITVEGKLGSKWGDSWGGTDKGSIQLEKASIVFITNKREIERWWTYSSIYSGGTQWFTKWDTGWNMKSIKNTWNLRYLLDKDETIEDIKIKVKAKINGNWGSRTSFKFFYGWIKIDDKHYAEVKNTKAWKDENVHIFNFRKRVGTFNSQSSYVSDAKKKLSLDKIIMSQQEFNSLDIDKLWKYLKINNNNLKKYEYKIKNLQKNYTNNSVSFDISTKERGKWTHYTKTEYLKISVFDFKDLFTIDRNFGQVWRWVGGKNSFYDLSHLPKLKLLWNNVFIKAINSYKNIGTVKDRINNFAWVNQIHKEEAIKKAEKLDINLDNIDFIFDYYRINNDFKANVYQPNWYKYIKQNNWNISQIKYINQLLHEVLSNSSLEIKVNIGDQYYDVKYNDLLNKNEFIIKLDTTILSSKSQRNWSVSIKNMKLINKNLNINAPTNIFLPESSQELFEKYNLLIKHKSSLKNELLWEFNLQTKPILVDKNISWKGMYSGIVMDDNFRIIKKDDGSSVSPLSKNDTNYGWQTAYFPFDEITKTIDSHYKLFITKINGEWFLKRNNSIKVKNYLQQAGINFDEKKIIYLFNEPITLLINPYRNLAQKTLAQALLDWKNKKGLKPVADYGISKVKNIFGGKEIILEDWNDGGINHLTNNEGIPIVDGIFGVDANGFTDSFAIFGNGKHQVAVELIKFIGKINTNFQFEVDTINPVIGLEDNNEILDVKPLFAKEIYDLIEFKKIIDLFINDPNLKSVNISFIDSFGNWYSFPLNVKQIRNNGRNKFLSKIKLNYQGIYAISSEDMVGNKKVTYINLTTKNNKGGFFILDGNNKNLEFVKQDILNDNTITFINSSSEDNLIVDINPLHKNRALEVFEGSSWQNILPINKEALKTTLNDISSKFYGRVADNSDSKILNYQVGDELKPFLTSFSSSLANKIKIEKPYGFKVKKQKLLRYSYDDMDGRNSRKAIEYFYISNSDEKGWPQNIKNNWYPKIGIKEMRVGFKMPVSDLIKGSFRKNEKLFDKMGSAWVEELRAKKQLESKDIQNNINKLEMKLNNLTDLNKFNNWKKALNDLKAPLKEKLGKIEQKIFKNNPEWLNLKKESEIFKKLRTQKDYVDAFNELQQLKNSKKYIDLNKLIFNWKLNYESSKKDLENKIKSQKDLILSLEVKIAEKSALREKYMKEFYNSIDLYTKDMQENAPLVMHKLDYKDNEIFLDLLNDDQKLEERNIGYSSSFPGSKKLKGFNDKYLKGKAVKLIYHTIFQDKSKVLPFNQKWITIQEEDGKYYYYISENKEQKLKLFNSQKPDGTFYDAVFEGDMIWHNDMLVDWDIEKILIQDMINRAPTDWSWEKIKKVIDEYQKQLKERLEPNSNPIELFSDAINRQKHNNSKQEESKKNNKITKQKYLKTVIKKNGLGIALGSMGGILLIGLGSFWWWKKRKMKSFK